MENRSHALMAGFFTIALLILGTLLAIWLGRDKIQHVSYEIVTRMAVSGLNPQAAVRYKGIKVGNVTDIDFDDKNPGQIVLRLEIIPDTPVTSSTYATLGYQGVTGIAFVQLDDDDTPKQALAANSKETNPDVVPRIPMRPGLMQNLEQRGQAILAQTEELTRRLNSLFDPTNQKSLMTAIDNVGKASAAWEALPKKLDPTIARLPELADQTSLTMTEIRNFSANASKLSNNLNQLTNNLQAPDGPLARFNLALDNVSNNLTLETLPKVQNMTEDARTSLRSIHRLSESIKERPQSLLFGNSPSAPGPGEPGFVAPK